MRQRSRTSRCTTRWRASGSGGFKHAYADLAGLKGKEPNAAASHTRPVTVAAEGGIVGFAIYAWLLVAALLLAFRRFARDLPGLTALRSASS